MRCRHADRLMSLKLDGAIRPEQAERLSEHLKHCPRCQAAWAAMQRAHGLLDELPWTEPTPDLTTRVLARLPEQRRGVIPTAPAWSRASVIVVAALALVLVGVTGVVLLTGVEAGSGAWATLQESGWSVVQAGWDSLRYLWTALSGAIVALWEALRWPWLPIAGALVVVAGVAWAWLWVRGSRRS